MNNLTKLAQAVGLHLSEGTKPLPRLPPPPGFWPNYVKKTYQELVDHLTVRKDSKGLALLDAFMDLAVQKAQYGYAGLGARMDALSDYFDKSKDTAANMMVERLAEGIDGVFGDIFGAGYDDDDGAEDD